MLDSDVPDGSRPVKVAWFRTTCDVTMKSSAVSVWIVPELGGRESVPIFPSGLPVEKEKELAEACAAVNRKAAEIASPVHVVTLVRIGSRLFGRGMGVWYLFIVLARCH